MGTGFFLRDPRSGHTDVITANHVMTPNADCTAGGSGLIATVAGGKTIKDWSRATPKANMVASRLDIAMLDPAAETTSNREALELSGSGALKTGDTVYMLGFGPRGDGDPGPASRDSQLRRPVVVIGTVLDLNASDGEVDVLTGTNITTQGQGQTVRPGDSGGPTVSQDGQAVATVDALRIESHDGQTGVDAFDFSGEQVQARYPGVHLDEPSRSRAFNIAVLSLLDKGAFTELSRQTRPCH
jgi:S1-C subfamily serine protease